jgi:hypothetical protein
MRTTAPVTRTIYTIDQEPDLTSTIKCEVCGWARGGYARFGTASGVATRHYRRHLKDGTYWTWAKGEA